MAVFYQINGFGACPSCLLFVPVFEDEGICFLQSLVPQGFDIDGSIQEKIGQDYINGGKTFYGLPFSITALIIFLIITKLMEHLTDMVDNMLNDLFSSWGASHLTGGQGQGGTEGAWDALKSIAGKDAETQKSIAQAKSRDNASTQARIEPDNSKSGQQPRRQNTNHGEGGNTHAERSENNN